MANTYYEIKPHFRWMADHLENETDLQYQSYNGGIQINVTDRRGGIHSYYPTTGTCIFHVGKSTGRTEQGRTFYQFVDTVQKIEKE